MRHGVVVGRRRPPGTGLLVQAVQPIGEEAGAPLADHVAGDAQAPGHIGIPVRERGVPQRRDRTPGPGRRLRHRDAEAVFDLGADRAIGSVILHPRTGAGGAGGGTAGFPVGFTPQARADGATSYTTARTITAEPNPNGAAQTYTLTSATGRYLRLKATELGKAASDESTKYRLQLAEMRVVQQASHGAARRARPWPASPPS
ncbi:hypothetical protein [Streptomyces tailanensis]|uniref:hypothetical protein n=1 Tax=Streptomyces tailanensis TaxID=2569858 RepID=UPI001FE8FAFA|nr:hypothetical protein [Streptomyces tailanensis]